MRIVGDSRRFVAAVFAVVAATVVDTAVAAVADTPAVFAVVDTVVAAAVDTAVAIVADTPAVFAATVADTAIAADTPADTAVAAVAAVVANHSKNYKIAQKSDRETHNLHDWFRTNQYAC